ncbi:hypothetical protein ABZT03_43170 [Streptomyces sp. NPDC005574]|uniref:hypothetical protein n=1 Tax=Streptomyces sp. NPDC005574 TaxID=3156891 RepID=UPI0033BCED70
MSVCATCYQPNIRDHNKHNCPGLGEIQVSRQLGRGLIVDKAPRRARMNLSLLANHGYGLTMQSNDLINLADQVLYQVVGYDPEHAALVLELVEDWRQAGVITFDQCMTDAEVEAFKTRWKETYGNSQAAHVVTEVKAEEQRHA